MCLTPYIKEIDGRLTPLPCGHCLECLKKYSCDWDFRLKQELKDNPFCWFITLTYNDLNLPVFFNGVKHESCVIPRELQLFFKRLRKNLGFPPIRYFAVGEYGKNNRAHYHILLFCRELTQRNVVYIQTLLAWQGRGFVYVKRATPERFHYLTKYVNKLDKRPHLAKPFKLMSNGIGLCFLTNSVVKHYLQHPHRYCFDNGKLVPMPRYYVKKLDELMSYRHSLNFSQLSFIYHHSKIKDNDIRWYHQYFCDNYDDIRDCFIQSELDNDFITKFLDPTVNIVFSWFLGQNKLTNDAILQSELILDKVKMKNNSLKLDQDIGKDVILTYLDDI